MSQQPASDPALPAKPAAPAATAGAALAARGVSVKLSGKTIISGVSVTCPAGKVTAVIGPSGSGKSTLLRCLGSVLKPAAGEVTAGGVPLARLGADFRTQLGFVPQDDIVHPELKVRHELLFAARLRLDDGLAPAEVEALVDRVIRRLGLAAQQGQRISRLSGGQRKRVNIGIELLADPGVLLLDEPASGLDPATEEDLLRALLELAAQGRTVVLTSHSMEYLHRMDQIVVMMEGALIFAGALSGLLVHFNIPHVAEMYRTLRGKDLAHWRQHWARGSKIHGGGC